MSATEKHYELETAVLKLLSSFHRENPDLFVRAIEMHEHKTLSGRRILSGIELTIEAQPALN